jgi:hypothetical protein
MLVYVRPSNEALLRARVPGAQDQRGCPSNPFYRGGSASKKNSLPAPSHHSEAERCPSGKPWSSYFPLFHFLITGWCG